ncbi:MAG: hypothetical protein ABII82_04750 [Verrucomicrobiota bacterium]
MRPLLLPLTLCLAGPLAALDLAEYPESDHLVLAALPADVQPVRSVRVKSPTDGLLTLNLPAPGTRLPEGAVWGEFDPERLQLEGEAVALARDLFKEKEHPLLDLELARNAGELAERRAELERQAGMLDRIAADPALAELYADETLGSAGVDEVATVAARLRRQLGLVDEVLRFVGTARENELEGRALELKLRAQELDFERRLREFRLAMPFAGELTLIPPPPPHGRPLRVPLGADLALLRDFSAVEARVPLRRAEWRLLDPAALVLRQARFGRAGLQAAYHRQILQETGGREELVCIFRFPDDQRAAARPLAGGQVVMELVLRLEQSTRIVPKIDLLLAAPDAIRNQGWDAGVASLATGARILAMGETHVAVVVAP